MTVSSQRRSFRLPRPSNTYVQFPAAAVHPSSPLKPSQVPSSFSSLYQKPPLMNSLSMAPGSKTNSVSSFTTFGGSNPPRKESLQNQQFPTLPAQYSAYSKQNEPGTKSRAQSSKVGAYTSGVFSILFHAVKLLITFPESKQTGGVRRMFCGISEQTLATFAHFF